MVRFLLVCVVVLCSGLLIPCQAVEIRVPGDYATIQAAIDAAVHGDEVIIANGTYRGDGNRDINFYGKAITVRSENGPDNCIIDCQGSDTEEHEGFKLYDNEGPDSILEGLTIRNGYSVFGGAIYCSGSSPTIRNCRLIDNYAQKGGGIYSEQGNPAIINCTIENNSSTIYGAGLYCEEATPIIFGCLFEGNTAEINHGGGICCTESDPNITSCTFRENTAEQRGPGIYAFSCPGFRVSNCVFEQNEGPQTGGIYSNNVLKGTIDRCTFLNNHSGYRGGGILLSSSDMLIRHCIFLGNHADEYGGGIGCISGGEVEIINCLISGNRADVSGGGIYIHSTTPILRNCTVVNNRAAERGGGMVCYSLSDAELNNCIFWGNDAELNLGNQISIGTQSTPSTVTISDSDAEGGEADVNVQQNCILNWLAGNLDVDPLFAAPGFWDDNGTPTDTTDDTWVIGSYYLIPGSDCIDSGDNSAVAGVDTDLVGHDRILNGTVDMGAYENDPGDLDVDKITVKAGKTREARGDSCSVSGDLDASESSFLAANTITLRTGEMAETLYQTAFTQSGKNPKYTYKGPSGGITSLILDFKKGVYSASGKNLDLTSMIAPVPVALMFGDYYGYTDAEDQGENDVINGKKSLPIQLLLGDTDYLKTTKVKCKQGKENNVGNLTVQGAIAVEEIVDLRTQGLTIHWGTQQYVLQGGDFTAKGTNKYIGKVKPSGDDSSSATVTIDFNKCTFKVVLKNTNMTWQIRPVDFGLEFDSFNEQESVDF